MGRGRGGIYIGEVRPPPSPPPGRPPDPRLVARPGLLTAEHLAGRRARYLRPLQLFLVFNVLLFLAAPTSPMFSYSLEKYLRSAPPSPALVKRMVAAATPGGHTHDPARGGRAFEAYAAAFDARVEVQRKSLVVLFAPAPAYVLLALRRVYRLGWPAAVGATALVAAAFMGLVLVYRGLLFFTTYYSL